ncbi:MAG: response regulator, partial [Candidatus Zixiibacteriota bacterium]
MPRVLLVDDEDSFRLPLTRRLNVRHIDTIEVGSGEDAIKLVRSDSDIDIVVLDLKMPGMNGEQVLQELKNFRPEIQVIMLTGHGSLNSAVKTGKLDAYSYLEKPCDLEKLIGEIESAREEKIYALTRHEIPHVEKGSLWKWLVGTHNSRPGIILLGIILFASILLLPTPDRLYNLISSKKAGALADKNMGYADYRKMKAGDSIASYYGAKYKIGKNIKDEDGKNSFQPYGPEKMATKAKVMLGILVIAALFWASGAVPVGITALLVGVIM